MRRTEPTQQIRLAVVIPTLDEVRSIGACLARLRGTGIDVVVADGGSADETVARALEASVRVIQAPRGRGPQMNAGVVESRGDVLLFLHADCLLPEGWAEAVRNAMADPRVVGGFFRVRTRSKTRGPLFNLAMRLPDARSRLLFHPYGDSGIFVRRVVFERMGGYRPLPIMEDYDFSARLAREGRIVRLPQTIEVSARRFEAGLLKASALMRVLPALYHLGVSPETLSRLYGVVR